MLRYGAAISEDLRHARDNAGREISRYEVAARMSELVGHEITKSMLDNWSAEAHQKHRFPIQYLPAFVMATGNRRVFDVVSRQAGLYALPGLEALRAEIQRLEEEARRIKAEKAKRMMFLREMEGVRFKIQDSKFKIGRKGHTPSLRDTPLKRGTNAKLVGCALKYGMPEWLQISPVRA